MAITPLQRFFSGLEESSYPTYKLYLNKFFDYAKISHEEFNELPIKEKTAIIEEYIFHLRAITAKTGKYQNSYNTLFQPIKRYCVMNDILLNWERLFKMMEKPKKLSGRKAYTDEDIKLFLDNSFSSRDRAIIHFLNSTAVRPGEIYLLNIGDVYPIEDGAIVHYYANTKSEYKVCLTPEAYGALKKYLDTRSNTKKEAPLFANKKGPIERRLAKSFFIEFMKSVRDRTYPNMVKDGSRKEKSANNAFRKRLEDIFSSIEMHHKYHSVLLDHNKDKQDSHYHSFEVIKDKTLWSKFKPAIPLISIDKSQMIIAEKDNEIETIKEEYEGALKEKLEKQDELMEKMALSLASTKYMMYEKMYAECFGGKNPNLERLARLMSNEEIDDWNSIISIVQREKDWTIKEGTSSNQMLRDSKEKREILALIKEFEKQGNKKMSESLKGLLDE